MAFPTRHVEVGSFVGAWPVVPSFSGPPQFSNRTVLQQATIVGVRRMGVAGFDISGRSMYLEVDGVSFQIAFFYSGALPIAEVVNQINAACSLTVAYNDNGFLKLVSPTVGDGSTLKLVPDPSSNPNDVFIKLGLFPGTESRAGDLVQALTIDPDRSVAPHGQLTMAVGENFESRHINRAIFQMAVNNDRNEGLLSKKRVGIKSIIDGLTYVAPIPGAAHGYQFSSGDLIYVGGISTPSTDQLSKLFAVLDESGEQLTHFAYVVQQTQTASFFIATDGTGKQICKFTGSTIFSDETSEKSDMYIMSTAFTGTATIFNGVPLKILEVMNAADDEVAIQALNPGTAGAAGTSFPIVDNGFGSNQNISVDIVTRVASPVLVDGVYQNAGDALASVNRLENVQSVRRSALSPTRIDLNNRIVFDGEDLTANPAVQVGDLLVWTGGAVVPFANEGTYRVDEIIDKETVRVVASDWGAAFLNSDLTSPGAIDITSDGAWVKNPFIRFSTVSGAIVPEVGQVYEIAHVKQTTYRDASDDVLLFAGDLRSNEDYQYQTQQAILRMYGPSVTSINSILYGDSRVSLESVNSRLSEEHYTYGQAGPAGSPEADTRNWGRHKNIRPDLIDMWPSNSTSSRVIIRGPADHAVPANDYPVLETRDKNDFQTLYLTSRGHIYNIDNLDSSRSLINMYWDNSTRYRLGAGAAGVGAQGGMKLENSVTSNSNSSSYKMLHLKQTINNATATAQGLGSTEPVTFLRCEEVIPSAHIDGLIWGRFRYLYLTMDYQTRSVTNTGFDYIESIYGIELNNTVAGNARIAGDHVGIFINDITRAGTGTGSEGAALVNLLGTGPSNAQNFAIYSKLGKVRFGDDVWMANNTNLLPETGATVKFGSASLQINELNIINTNGTGMADYLASAAASNPALKARKTGASGTGAVANTFEAYGGDNSNATVTIRAGTAALITGGAGTGNTRSGGHAIVAKGGSTAATSGVSSAGYAATFECGGDPNNTFSRPRRGQIKLIPKLFDVGQAYASFDSYGEAGEIAAFESLGSATKKVLLFHDGVEWQRAAKNEKFITAPAFGLNEGNVLSDNAIYSWRVSNAPAAALYTPSFTPFGGLIERASGTAIPQIKVTVTVAGYNSSNATSSIFVQMYLYNDTNPANLTAAVASPSSPCFLLERGMSGGPAGGTVHSWTFTTYVTSLSDTQYFAFAFKNLANVGTQNWGYGALNVHFEEVY